MKLRLFINSVFITAVVMQMTTSASGQFMDTLVSSFHKPHKFFFTANFSKTFGANSGTDVIGFKLGSEQNGRIYYGIGYYIFNTDVVNDKTVTTETGSDTLVPAQLKLRFFTISPEYVFYRSNRWQFGVPLNIGYGKSYYEYFKAHGEKAKTTKTGSMIFSVGISGHYKFIPWVGLSFGTGYASTFGTNKNNDQDFNAMTYSIGVKIFFDEIYQSLKALGKDEKQQLNDNDEGPQPDL